MDWLFAHLRATGAVADTWLSEGGDLIAEFDSVVKCGAHTLGGSCMVKAYENAGEAGIVQLSACTRNDGVSWAQVAKAIRHGPTT